jgi:hypothetical protein
MSFNDIDIDKWESVEDFPTHRTVVTELSNHNFRCEIQIRDDFIWGELYDITAGKVVAENDSIAQGEEWKLEEINQWIQESLKEYFSNED